MRQVWFGLLETEGHFLSVILSQMGVFSRYFSFGPHEWHSVRHWLARGRMRSVERTASTGKSCSIVVSSSS